MKKDNKKLNLKLLKQFPELEKKFHEEADWQDGLDTGSIVIFEDVFKPYIYQCFDNHNEDKLKMIFQFIEDLIRSDDPYEQNVVGVALIEDFALCADKLQIKKYLLPKSLKSYNESKNWKPKKDTTKIR